MHTWGLAHCTERMIQSSVTWWHNDVNINNHNENTNNKNIFNIVIPVVVTIILIVGVLVVVVVALLIVVLTMTRLISLHTRCWLCCDGPDACPPFPPW